MQQRRSGRNGGSGRDGPPRDRQGQRGGPGRPTEGRAPSPRPHRQTKRPAKPPLPAERPRVRRDVYRDLKGAARPNDVDDVVRAYGAAGEALNEGNTEQAVTLLTWAKSAASRSAAIRGALGVALYLHGDFEAAHRELLAYRRLSNRFDQNHLLADCARALGRREKMEEYVEEMQRQDVPRDRIAEALIVLAGDRADRGDFDGALAALGRVGLNPDTVEDYHARLWYAAADVCERMGQPDRAREYLQAIAAVTDSFLDVEERLGGDG